MNPKFFSILLTLFIVTSGFSQSSENIEIISSQIGETIIAVDDDLHNTYGLAYPVTYQFEIPSESDNLQAFRRFSETQEWSVLEEKTSDDFFNGIEVVRFDYEHDMAYVSLKFDAFSDSIFLKITDATGNNTEASCLGITQYYDNRDAAVTSSADDWAEWSNQKFLRTVRIFRDYHLWLSVGIVTQGCTASTWEDIQNQLDSGYVEAVSHSQTHPNVPYESIFSEVAGSKADIINNLDLPDPWRKDDMEYVYAWIAPYGQYNADIAAVVSQQKYLVSRMYYDQYHQFSSWDDQLEMFEDIGVSREVGPLWAGITDTIILNSTFDDVLNTGGVYHVMCHPNVIEWEEEYPWNHLSHISNRKNIWYAGLGHLYLYRLMQYPGSPTATIDQAELKSNHYALSQNYPNPFKNATTITYTLPDKEFVNIALFDQYGRHITTFVNQKQIAGVHQFSFEANNLPPGIYLYTMRTGKYMEARKLIID